VEPEYQSSPSGGPAPLDRDELMRRTGPLYPGLVAVRQLTSAPALGRAVPTRDDAKRAAVWFPAVGGLVGGLLALLALLVLEIGLVPAIAGALVVAAATIVTGALHERGFARSIEALLGGGGEPAYQPSGALGLYGVVSVIALLAARGVFLLGIDAHAWVGAIIVSQMVLRWSPVFLQRIGDPLGEASPGERTLLVGQVSWIGLALGSGFVLVIAILFAGWTGILSLVIAAGVAFAVGLFYQRREGGLTGDTLAAASVVCELAVLLCFAAARAASVSPWAS
jgi:adenosylcobinamide-GDP ribazoletransferase